MYHIQNKNWLYTADGEPRGFIEPERLKELWFHTGNSCNLSCPFCFEQSSPGDCRIDFLKFDVAKQYIDNAVKIGVDLLCFTGGEPFMNDDIIRILDYALDRKPCLLLTNGTEPLIKKINDLKLFARKPNSMTFRISIDSPYKEIHDDMRGKGNFAKAVKSLSELHRFGFKISVARCEKSNENSEKIESQYKKIFSAAGIPENTHIAAFPNLQTEKENPEITERCMTTHCTSADRSAFMCSSIKMVAVKNGKPGIFACTLVDNDDDYNFGENLELAMNYRVMLKHKRCFTCFSSGVTCSES